MRGARARAGLALLLLAAVHAGLLGGAQGEAGVVAERDALAAACGGAADTLRAHFQRKTFTPLVLFFRAGEHAEPCALMKLTCVLLSNARRLTVVDKGQRGAREPFGGNTWAELLVHAVLARSARASGAIAPGSGGAVLRGASARARADHARVHSTCAWPDDTLVGHVQAYVPGVQGAALQHLAAAGAPAPSSEDAAALAALLIADALTLSNDRSATRNVFARADGRLFAADLSSPEAWELTCPGAAGPYEAHARARVRAPNFLHVDKAGGAAPQHCGGAVLLAVLRAARELARDACGPEPDCAALRTHLESFAAADPWFRRVLRDAEQWPEGSRVAPLCCVRVSGERARGARAARACHACAGPFRGAGVHIANASCFPAAELQRGLGAFLAADAARRVAFLLRELDAAVHDCGGGAPA